MTDVKVGLIIEGDSRDARREIDRTEKEIDQLKRGNRELGRASQNYGRRAVQANRQVARSHRETSAAVVPLKRAIVGLVSAYAGIAAVRGLGRLSGQFIDAASEAEGFRVRLNTLLGSVYEGNRAFDEMAEFAGTVPFEYREIMAAATQLAGVMEGGVDEIKQFMPVIADLAAVSGLTIEETTSQVIRMYSAGAASADMFRERGILAMLGFQSGVSYSADETRRKLIQAWEDPASKFRGATEDLAKNWTGIMSMMSDSWFQFRDSMMEDTVLWDFLKTALDEFRIAWAEALDWNQSEFDAWADGVITVLKYTGVAFTTLWDVAMAPKRIFDALIALNDSLVQMIILPMNKIGLVSDETYNAIAEGAEQSRNNVDRLNQTTSDFLTKIEEIEAKAREAFQMRQVNAAIEETIAKNKELFGTQKRVTEAMEETGKTGAAAMDDINKAIDKLIQNEELFAMSWKANLQDRFEATQDSLRTELEALEANRREQLEIIDAAERQGLDSIVSYAELRRRVDEQYQEERARLEQQGADRMEEIWSNATENMQREFANTIYDALWEDGIDSFGDFADTVLDIWKRMIAEMVAAWITSGLAGLLAGEGFSGFSIGGSSGSTGNTVGNAVVGEAIKQAGQEWLPQVFGGSTSGGGQQMGWTPAAGSGGGASAGASSAAQLSGNAQVAQSGLHAGTGAAATTGAASAAQLTGSAQVAQSGLHVGTGSAAGSAGMSTAMTGAAVLAAPFIAGALVKELQLFGFGNTPEYGRALRDVQRHGFTGPGPLGGQVGAGDNFSYFGGENAGFAAEFARGQGVQPVGAGLSDQGIAAFRGVELPEMIKLLEDAQTRFEEVQTAGTEAFGEVGQMLQDGVISQAELAARGIKGLGDSFIHPKTGAIEYKAVTVDQFKAVADAINSGELRLRALQDETIRTAEESRILGEIFSDALNGAADSARGLSDEIRAIPSEKTITIHERRVTSAVERRHGTSGGGGAPNPERSLAVGTPFVPHDMLAQIHAREIVMDPASSDALRKYGIRVQGGGGMDAETRSLLRSIDGRLARLDDLSTRIDDRSVAELARRIAEPITKEQRRETRHRDRQATRRAA